MQVCHLTSEAEILLIDLDHEFSVNISKHAAIHPVRHKPNWSTWKTVRLPVPGKKINRASSEYQWSKVMSLGYIILFLKTHYLNGKRTDWPCIGFTAALQQRQQDRIVLVAAVILSFIVQVGQQFNTLRRATRHWADIPSDRLNTAMIDDILQFADKRALTTGKVAWPAPKGPSTQHSSDRYLRLKENRFFWSDYIFIKVLSVGTRLLCQLGEAEVQKGWN